MRENQLAVAVVLGACALRLRVCACVGRSSAASGWRGRCRLIGAFVVVQEVLVQASERAKGRGIPAGGVLEVGARQPDLLSGASKGAQEGYNLALVVYDAARRSPAPTPDRDFAAAAQALATLSLHGNKIGDSGAGG